MFFFQAEDGIRDLVRSRGLGDVYKRQVPENLKLPIATGSINVMPCGPLVILIGAFRLLRNCLLYTSDAADERSSVDLGGRRIIKKKTTDRLLRAFTVTAYTAATYKSLRTYDAA